MLVRWVGGVRLSEKLGAGLVGEGVPFRVFFPLFCNSFDMTDVMSICQNQESNE